MGEGVDGAWRPLTYNNTNRPTQLPSLASRPDHVHPVSQFRHRIHPLAPPRRQHPRPRPILQLTRTPRRTKAAAALLHQCGPPHGLPPSGRGSCRLHLRSICASLGQAPSIPTRHGHHHSQFNMGGLVESQLQQPVGGALLPGCWTGSVW